MNPQPPGRHYSPDGKFWWDGAAWQPVDAPSSPGAGPAAAPVAGAAASPYGSTGPGNPAAPPYGPGGRPSHAPVGPVGVPPVVPGKAAGGGKAPAVLVTIAVVVLGLVAGGITGAVVGAVTTEPVGPASPPPLTENFPSAEKQYLSGVTLTVIAKDWLEKANSWVCAPDAESRRSSGAKQAMECEPRDKNQDVWVSIEYDDEAKVRAVSANCGDKPGSNGCKTLFATFADALFAKQPELRKQAGDWANKNAESDSTTVIGGIWMRISLGSTRRMDALPWI